jgi:hypothetical protein
MAEGNVLKALVDDALERSDLHPDRRTVLQEWRDQNTSEEEKESRLSDEEREEQRQEEDKGKEEDESKDDKPPTPATPTSTRKGR